MDQICPSPNLSSSDNQCSIVTEATEKKVGQHHAKECQHLVQAENGVLYVHQHQAYTKCPEEEIAVPRVSRGKVTNKLKWLHDVTILAGCSESNY